jgi:hypothetical protein
MSDIHDEHTYCCDQCGVPVVLSNLIPVGKEHWCRFCVARPANAGRSTFANSLRSGDSRHEGRSRSVAFSGSRK